MVAERTKNVVITGAASGLGRASAELMAKRGWQVFAADFNEAALKDLVASTEGIVAVPMDVTSEESVDAAVAKVRKYTTKLDGVVNFAGIMAVGSLIELPESTLRRLFEVNVFGTFRVNQAFFPLIKSGKGRIVNISSETGWQSGAPFNGPYAMTKHAIEAYSDSLRRELALVDIPVIKIQPGPFKTEMTNTISTVFERAAEQSKLFSDVLLRMKPLAVREGETSADPSKLADVVHLALTTRNPSADYPVKTAAGRAAMELLPTQLSDLLLKVALGAGRKKQN